MAQMALPAAPSYQRTSYSRLLGCDFSVDQSLVDRRHSPDCLNMISDNGDNPIKRKGWEIVKSHTSGTIENIWNFESTYNFIVYTCTVGTAATLHCIKEDGTEYTLKLGGVTVNTGKLGAFYTAASVNQWGLYVLDKTKMHRIYYTGSTIAYEEVTPYVPTVLISRTPTGGGVTYENINLLTRARKEEFLNTANNRTFVVSSSVDTAKPYSLYYRNSSGGWSVDSGATVSGATFTASSVYSPVAPSQDNIRIEYYASSTDKSSTILKCTMTAHYSLTVPDQIFVSGNPSYPRYAYYSALGDVTYFPDLNYLNIGGKSTIMGFLNLGEYLAIVKSGSYDDSTVFLVSPTSYTSSTVSDIDGSTRTTQERTFSVKRSIAGIGAISKYAFGVLNDEPLFLSDTGVYGITSSDTTTNKIVRNRSFLLDQKLLKETNLKNAVCAVWDNYYMLVVNSHAYILDGRHKTNNYAGNTSYGYESYYWENIPAICITSYDRELWFGTSDGKVCRFKNSGSGNDYSDGTMIGSTEGGTAITARWSTPYDNDDRSEYFKTLMKKGTMCTVAPYERSSVNVYISIDGYSRTFIGKWNVDIANLFDGVIDFERLSFNTDHAPRDAFFKKKFKKYKRLQIILENDSINEPFGVFEIVKTYIYQRFAK